MDRLIRIGMDTSKNVFQLHGVNEEEEPVLRRKLRRAQMISFMSRLTPTIVGIEAGGAAHYWARTFAAMGHEVKIMAPQFVKPYVKRGKNDAADAEALCGDEPAYHAFRAAKDGRTAGCPDAGVDTRPPGAVANPVDQRDPRICCRVWFHHQLRCPQGCSLCRACCARRESAGLGTFPVPGTGR
jgi:hypothetical protein